jgi:glycosyltransferase involved in cell wall biosynthesis
MVGDAGLTFPVGSSDGLQEAVERLVADPDLRARLAAATEPELERFEPERILDTYEEVYERFAD